MKNNIEKGKIFEKKFFYKMYALLFLFGLLFNVVGLDQYSHHKVASIIPTNLLSKMNRFQLKRNKQGKIFENALDDTDPSTSAIAHIFLGGFNNKVEPVGLHVFRKNYVHKLYLTSRPPEKSSDYPSAKKIIRETGTKNKYGAYAVEVYFRNSLGKWCQKKRRSMIFPDNWSDEVIINSIIEASNNARCLKGNEDGESLWQGSLSTGMRINMTINSKGYITNAYPSEYGVR
ncbi:TPA: EndoU domain-containing protein [Enterococcus faecium]